MDGDTDMEDTNFGDTDMVDTDVGDTDMVDTNVGDTDMVDTVNGYTDMVYTDVGDTETRMSVTLIWQTWLHSFNPWTAFRMRNILPSLI